MGVMKSAVATRARSSSMRHTAASSPVSVPTSRSGWLAGVKERRTCANSLGASLQAQPAPWLNWLSRRLGSITERHLPQLSAAHLSAAPATENQNLHLMY